MRIGNVEEVQVAASTGDSIRVAKDDTPILQPAKADDNKGVAVEAAPEAEDLEPVVAGGVRFPAGTKIRTLTKFERTGVYPYQSYGSVAVDMPDSKVITKSYIIAELPDGKGTVTIPANRSTKHELDQYDEYSPSYAKAPLQYKNAYVDIDDNGRVIFNNVYFTDLKGTDGDDQFVFQGYQRDYETQTRTCHGEYSDRDVVLTIERCRTTFPRGAQIDMGAGNDVLSGQLGGETTRSNPHYIDHVKESETQIKAAGNLRIEGTPTHYLGIDVDGELDLTNIAISPNSFTGGVSAKLPDKE